MDQDIQQQQQAIPQPILQQIPQQELSKVTSSKILWIVLGIIIVLGLSGGIYYFGIKKNSVVTTYKKITPKNTVYTSTYTPSPKVNGKIYTNNQFGYTFTYPVDWQAVESLPTPVTYPPITDQPQVGGYLQKGELQKTTFVKADIGSCYLSVLENTNHMALDQWASSYKVLSAAGENLAKVTGNTTLGENSAKTISIFAFDHTDTAIVTEYNNSIYFFEYSNTKNNPNYSSQQQTAETICLQIASSFQFLRTR